MLKTIPQLVAQAKKNISTIQAAEGLSLSQKSDAILVDVREPEEFNKKHLPSAINIPRGVLEMQMIGKYPHAEMTIVIHCAAGARAILAAEQLKNMGYKNVSAITCKFEDILSIQN